MKQIKKKQYKKAKALLSLNDLCSIKDGKLFHLLRYYLLPVVLLPSV